MNKIYDISVKFTPKMAVWPSSAPFKYEVLRNIEEHKAQVSSVEFNLHTGTHVDTSKHFLAQGKTIDQIPLERFIGPVMVYELLESQKIDRPELQALNIPTHVKKIIFKTKNSQNYLSAKNFDENYVALTCTAAEWLAQSHLELVGIDAPSIELYHGRDYSTHKVLLNQDMIILEGLNLNQVAAGEYYLWALPLNIEGAEASPVRAVLLKSI